LVAVDEFRMSLLLASQVDEEVSRGDEALLTPGLDPLMGNFELAATPGLLDPAPQLKYAELGMLAQVRAVSSSHCVSLAVS
jgi:hypothetical protein